MKAYFTSLAISLIFLSACSTTYYSSAPYDDVYYRSADTYRTRAVNENPANRSSALPADNQNQNVVYQNSDNEAAADYSTTETFASEDSTVYVTNNNYYYDSDYDNNYDYYYTARLRRFHNYSLGFAYYDPYYTNLYWYDYDPYHWGSSIYLSHNLMYPYYTPYYCRYWDWPYGAFSWSWDYGYYPYRYSYLYGYGWNSWYGWRSWYNYYPRYGYYYNSYDRYSHYYQPRSTRGKRHYRSSGLISTPNAKTFGEMYENKVRSSRVRSSQSTFKNSEDTRLRTTAPVNSRSRYDVKSQQSRTQAVPTRQPYNRMKSSTPSRSIQRTEENKTRVVPNNGRNIYKPKDYNIRDNTNRNPAPNNAIRRYNKPETYQSPASRQPNSSRQYTSPKSNINRVTQPVPKSQNQGIYRSSPARKMSSPAKENRNYSAPSRSRSSNSSGGGGENNSAPRSSSRSGSGGHKR